MRVSYVPQENGDPITTKFAGFDFKFLEFIFFNHVRLA